MPGKTDYKENNTLTPPVHGCHTSGTEESGLWDGGCVTNRNGEKTMKTTRKATWKASLVTLGLLGILTACSSGEENTNPGTSDSGSTPSATEKTVVRVGVVGEYNAHWDTVNELLEEENIVVELVKYTDAIPNDALADGDVDLNAFQHKAFLKDEVSKTGYDIVPIGDTIIGPLGMFPNTDEISSLADFQDGDKIAIPANATNYGRALLLMESAGLLVIDPECQGFPTKSDIIEYIVEIEILDGETATLASMLPDLSAAIINAGDAITAGLDPTTDTILLEDIDPETNPHVADLINIIAARGEDADNEIFAKIVSAYQTDEVADAIFEHYDGAYFPAW